MIRARNVIRNSPTFFDRLFVRGSSVFFDFPDNAVCPMQKTLWPGDFIFTTSPMEDPERFALLPLYLVDGIGPERLRRLMDRFGSAQAVPRAPRRELGAVDQS